jgi:hypothetical protein
MSLLENGYWIEACEWDRSVRPDLKWLDKVIDTASTDSESGIMLIAGNLHLNIITKEFRDDIRDAIEPYVYELVGEL